MLAINIVLELFSGIRTRREVRCTVTCAAIGNSGVGMCLAAYRALHVWVLRSAWDGAVHFLRAWDERQVVEPQRLSRHRISPTKRIFQSFYIEVHFYRCTLVYNLQHTSTKLAYARYVTEMHFYIVQLLKTYSSANIKVYAWPSLAQLWSIWLKLHLRGHIRAKEKGKCYFKRFKMYFGKHCLWQQRRLRVRCTHCEQAGGEETAVGIIGPG